MTVLWGGSCRQRGQSPRDLQVVGLLVEGEESLAWGECLNWVLAWLADFCPYPVEAAWLKSLVHEAGLLVHRSWDLDSKPDVQSIPRAGEWRLTKCGSLESVCLFSLHLEKFQEMLLQRSRLLLSQASLPVAPGCIRRSRGQATSALGPGRLFCLGQEAISDFFGVLYFHARAYSWGVELSGVRGITVCCWESCRGI